MRTAAIVIATITLAAAATTDAASPTATRITHALRLAKAADKRSKAAYAAAQRAVSVVPARGATGRQGASGEPGRNGAPGVDGARGEQGPKGDTGPQGPQGEQGPPGPAGVGGVKAHGYVSATGTGTTTQGATVTHPGLGVYCITAPELTALVVTPDGYATAFVQRPGGPGTTCPTDRWTVVVANNSGADTGFFFIGQ